MRKSTLLVVSYLITFPIVYLGPELLWSLGYLGPRWHIGTTSLASLILAGVMSVLLTPLNRRILKWRKDRGRDIEEEERYETGHGMIKLTPNPDDHQDR